MIILRNRQSGITLIELLMALSIAAVLFAIGAPALGSMLAHAHEQSAEGALQASLMHARETAITRNMRVVVCPSIDAKHCTANVDWQSGWIVGIDADGDREPDAQRSALAVFNALPQGLRVMGSRGRTHIVFQPDGSAGGSNAQLTICHHNDTRDARAVIVSNSGRVRIASAESDRLQACLAGLH